MPKIPRLHRRDGGYYFRARVPKSLIEKVNANEALWRELTGKRGSYRKKWKSLMGPKGSLKRETWRSLNTASYSEAKRAVNMHSAEFDQLCDEIILAFKPKSDEPDLDQVKDVVMHWFADKRQVLEYNIATLDDKDVRSREAAIDDFVDVYSNDPQNENTLMETADKVFLAAGLKVDRKSPSHRHLRNFINRGEKLFAHRWLEATEGNFDQKYQDSFFDTSATVSQRSPLAVTGSRTLAQLIEEYMSEKAQGHLSPKTPLKYNAVFALVKEVMGEDKQVNLIDRNECRHFRDILKSLPSNRTKRFKKMTLHQIVKEAERQQLKPMALSTAKSYLTTLSSMFKWAVLEEYMDKNPAEGLSVGKPKVAKRDLREPFTPNDLNKIFHAPLYTGCVDDERNYAEPGPERPRRGRFWIPLISLWTGMRLNECCQLETSDIQTIDGVLCFKVSPDSLDGQDKADPLPGEIEAQKRLKTSSSRRSIPVHPTIIALGFPDYVQQRKEKGDRRLFPELKPGSTTYLSDPYSKWFVRFLTKVGVKESRKSFHSFRHNFRDAMRRARMGRDAVVALGGWKATSTDDEYGSGLSPELLLKEIEKLEYPGLDLSHLYDNQAD